MVCVPCFIIPLLLYLWHRFVQPYVLYFWNPWAVKSDENKTEAEFPFKCEGGVCRFGRKPIDTKESTTSDDQTKCLDDKLNDDNKLKAE